MSNQPNVLIFMVDQQRYDACGCFGSQICRTPHLDRLVEQGVKFTNAFASVPLCTPTRASFWSGLWPSHHGVLINGSAPIPMQLPQLRDLRVGFELTPGRVYLACKTFGWHTTPVSTATPNHHALGLAAVKYITVASSSAFSLREAS